MNRSTPDSASGADTTLARSFIYRLIAQAFEDPAPENWSILARPDTHSIIMCAAQALGSDALVLAARDLITHICQTNYENFESDYMTCFGHTVRGDCPMNEIEYGDIKADPLFQPHRLADLGAFYAAFGLEIVPDAAERQDHISIELEFMSALAAKEAYAREYQYGFEPLMILRDVQKKFIREHLGRWTPAFTRRLARMADGTALGALANFTREFIALECAAFGIAPGSEDLLLRPIDEASESLCASCGIANLPPGATRSPIEG
jgi:putative dimethyl sulfoxide reductase chaperone